MTPFISALLLLAPVTSYAGGQGTLADVARQEAARRKTIKQPAKVYTNTDARPATAAEADAAKTPATPAAATPTPAPPAANAEKPAEDPKKDQKYWHDRIASARAELDRSKVYLDALQSRINALSTDFVNRDDPAQRSVIEADRKRAIAELERLKAQIQLMTKGIADIEEEARRLGVPPGWLR
jgi:hypothetical protein